jgi:hypothetical protein
MWLMYKSFQGKIPAAILMPTLFIVNICPHIFFYASQTYSEPFFMLTQSFFIYLFSKYFWNGSSSGSLQIKTDWKKLLFLGCGFLCMGLTRTIGFAVIGAVILYFCFEKQWKNLLYSLVSSGLVFILFSIVKKIVWPESGASYDINNYLAKNFYNVEQGMEDLPGFIDRLVVNSHIYLSNFLYQFMGFRSISNVIKDETTLLTLLAYFLFFSCIFVVFKKNKPLLFTGIYAGVMNFASFILLQTIWAQNRLIMIYYPLILLLFLGGLYYFLKNKALKKMTWLYPLFLVSLLFGTSLHLKTSVALNVPILQQNLSGNDLYGLTPDWENFIKMSRWANDNLEKDAVIVSRKPSISYVYTGREFHGIYTVPTETIQDVVKKIRDDKDDYVFLVVEFTNQFILELAPYTEYVFTNKKDANFVLNGQKFQYALIYKIKKSEYRDDFITLLEENKIAYTLDYSSFLTQFVNDNQVRFEIISPERLMSVIRDNRVNYLILAKIRLYTPENTGLYVNTIHHYIYFSQFKYPDAFRIIHVIGKEESCEIAQFIGK